MGQESAPILLVEDDPLVLDCTAEILTEGGYEVTCARTADEAMEFLERGPVPSMVVTDIALSDGVSGLDLARTVAERWPDVRLLIVSGSERPPPQDYPEHALFFTKPYPGDALLAMVKGTDW